MKHRFTRSTFTILMALALVGAALLLPISALATYAATPVAHTFGPLQHQRSTPAQLDSCSATGPHDISFTLDNVTVAVHSPFLPSYPFDSAQPGNASQVAGADCFNPYRQFLVTAVPFGTTTGTEALPVAHAGGADVYRSALRNFRVHQGGRLSAGPIATLFAQRVMGDVSLVNLPHNSSIPRPTQIVEWVVEAGKRLWIVRFSQEETPSGMTSLSSLDSVQISSTTLDHPSTLTSGNTLENASLPPAAPHIVYPDDLSNPPWWSGSLCDDIHYYPHIGIHSYQLPGNTPFQGMVACGPIPDGNWRKYDNGVQFFPRAWGVQEWQCVELSMRYLYLKYRVPPYSADGSGVADNYAQYNPNNHILTLLQNNTQGNEPQVGDILSMDSGSNGHTSVVTRVTYTSPGTGTIFTIEQNANKNGNNQINVSGWHVGSNVADWLHHPGPLPGQFAEYPIPTANSTPQGITTGSDGNLWFTEYNSGKIGRVTSIGKIDEFALPDHTSAPLGITADGDHGDSIWFTESNDNKIGRMLVNGQLFREHPIPTSSSIPQGITIGPDGNFWFTEFCPCANKIGTITHDGVFAAYPIPTSQSGPEGITAGPDGNLWFTECLADKIGRITPNGQTITEFPIPYPACPENITAGSDGNLWFTEHNSNIIGTITPGGAIYGYVLPSPNSQLGGITSGPNGNLWFTDYGTNQIGQITPNGQTITEYPLPTANAIPVGITTGPDGDLWFVEVKGNMIMQYAP